MRITTTGVTINEDSQDYDFRVESNNLANAFMVNGGTNQVMVNAYSTSSPFEGDSDRDFKHDSKFTINASELGDTAGNTTGIATFGYEGNTGHGHFLEFMGRRDTSGGSWEDAGMRIQNVVDSVAMGYIEFNGEAGNYGISMGKGGSADYTSDPAWQMDDDGIIKKVKQPAFSALKSSSTTGEPDNTEEVIVVFNTEIFDQNSDYNNSNGYFTAPVTGRYLFGWNIRIEDINSTTDYIWTKLVTSNRTYLRSLKRYDMMGFSGQVHYWMQKETVFADMDSGDTAYVSVATKNASDNTVDIYGDSTPQTHFWGYLVC